MITFATVCFRLCCRGWKMWVCWRKRRPATTRVRRPFSLRCYPALLSVFLTVAKWKQKKKKKETKQKRISYLNRAVRRQHATNYHRPQVKTQLNQFQLKIKSCGIPIRNRLNKLRLTCILTELLRIERGEGWRREQESMAPTSNQVWNEKLPSWLLKMDDDAKRRSPRLQLCANHQTV